MKTEDEDELLQNHL